MKSCLDCARTDLHGDNFCQPHYRKRFRAGTLPKRKSAEERFWAQVEVTGFCWNWTAATYQGYGRVVGHRSRHAHRVAYELLVGSIPEGLQLDHLCRNRACVNPDHLEPVTLQENIARRPPLGTRNHYAGATHCKHGHPFDIFTTLPSGAKRKRCSVCNKRWEAERPKRKKHKLQVV